ncbi:unnamed protein product [Sphagnum troendelagicum]
MLNILKVMGNSTSIYTHWAPSSKKNCKKLPTYITVNSKAHCLQISQLEADIAASNPAPGFPAPSTFETPVNRVPGFSIVPAALKPSGFGSGTTPLGRLDATLLSREMSNSLSHGRLEETVRLFDDWVKLTDAAGNPNKPNILAYNLLLHAKLRLGAHPDGMYQIINEMESAGIIPTQLTYNFVLRSVFRQRDSRLAEKILEKMEQAGPEAQPDGDSYNFVIALCALDRRIAPALKHMQSMYERGFVPSKTTYNELLVACARVHRTRFAVALLKELKTQQLMPQVQTVGELAIASTEVDDAECALLTLEFLTQQTLGRPSQPLNMDEGGMVALLGTAARTGNGSLNNEAWNLLTSSLGPGRIPNPASYCARVHACASAGDFETAFNTVREMELAFGNLQGGNDPEILSPCSSLRPLVLAIARAGPGALDAAYYKLAEIHASGRPVCLAAINSVLQGCANIWDVDRAYQTFEAISTTFGLTPDIHSINALLDAFGKARKISEVQRLYEYMKELGLKPDHRTYDLLITAHVINRDIEAAMGALTTLMDDGHTPMRDTLFKVWRRCRREGDVKAADKLRALMKSLGYRDCYLGEGRRRLISAGLPVPAATY